MKMKLGGKRWHWMLGGLALGVLDVLTFNHAVAGRPIGASTAFPWAAGMLTGQQTATYMEKIQTSGSWEAVMLAGALVGALIAALAGGTFRLRIVPEGWSRHRGSSNAAGRLAWAFVGGFLLILGARLAGGCTSGHMLSGGMQLAASSLVFGVFGMGGALVAGKLFYRGGGR